MLGNVHKTNIVKVLPTKPKTKPMYTKVFVYIYIYIYIKVFGGNEIKYK